MQEEYFQNKKLMQQELAAIIKKHRQKRGKSISLISNEIGMTKSMWADLEKSNKDPQLTSLWRMAEALELPLSEIIIELEDKLTENFSLVG